MKLTRNKTIGILGLWMFSFLLNLLGFGWSAGPMSANNNQNHFFSRQETRGVDSPTVFVAYVASPQVAISENVECGVVSGEAFALQNSTSAFLLMPKDCFSVSLGHVATLSQLTVLDNPSQYSVAVQRGSGETFSAPVSFRGMPRANFEAVLPSVQTTAERTMVAIGLIALVFIGMSRVVKEYANSLDIIYLQVFRC